MAVGFARWPWVCMSERQRGGVLGLRSWGTDTAAKLTALALQSGNLLHFDAS